MGGTLANHRLMKKKRENLSDHEKGFGRNKVEILKNKGDEMWEVGV